jgi:glyoxylase-like metal-dependent hydrolase (beta-lactamase superfamily II)
VAIPGPSVPSGGGGRFAGADQIKSRFYQIRDYANESMYLIAGSTRALLIGTGSGTPGLAGFVKKLAGALPVDVIVTSDDPGQMGGLNQFATGEMIYLPAGAPLPAFVSKYKQVATGDRIDLGRDTIGRPLVIEVHQLKGHSPAGITLLDVNNRVLFGGDALGTQDGDAGLILRDPLPIFGDALAAWRRDTDGKYDVVYTAHNYQWFTSAAYVDQLQSAVARGLAEGASALIDSTRMPGAKMIRSNGAADVVASIVVPAAR